MHSLLAGFGLGFLVALQVGPMSLLLVRTTLRAGLVPGLAVGAGIAGVDAAYAAAGAAGAAPLLASDPLRLALGLCGGALLVTLGVRTLWSAFRVRAGAETPEEVATPGRAFLIALAGTASNPLTIASWAALFAAASSSGAGDGPLLVLGAGLGSLSWCSGLAAATGAARRAVGPRALRAADAVAGAGLVASGGLLAWRTGND